MKQEGVFNGVAGDCVTGMILRVAGNSHKLSRTDMAENRVNLDGYFDNATTSRRQIGVPANRIVSAVGDRAILRTGVD
jgi:hypothetical protein